MDKICQEKVSIALIGPHKIYIFKLKLEQIREFFPAF